MQDIPFYVHPSAEVEPGAEIGAGTRIWRQAHIRAHAHIGEMCNIGKGVYVETHVHIGSRVKIQNNASLFEGVTVEDGVFIGPHVCFTNDMFPRAITPDGQLKGADDLEYYTYSGKIWSLNRCWRSDCLWRHYWRVCAYWCWFSRDKGCCALYACLWQSSAFPGLCMQLRPSLI